MAALLLDFFAMDANLPMPLTTLCSHIASHHQERTRGVSIKVRARIDMKYEVGRR